MPTYVRKKKSCLHRLRGRNMSESSDLCYLCGNLLPDFLKTPLVKLTDGSFTQFCEICAENEFPGWDKNEDMGED